MTISRCVVPVVAIMALFTVTAALAQDAALQEPSPQQEFKQLLADFQEVERLESERKAAAADMDVKIRNNQRLIEDLRKEGGMSQQEIDLAKNYLEHLRDQIKQYEAQITQVEARLAIANMAAPDKKIKADALQAETEELKKQAEEKRRPAAEKLSAFRKEIEGRGKALEQVLKASFRDGSGDFADVKVKNFNFDYDRAFISIHWQKEGKGFVWAHVRIRPDGGTQLSEKIADKYPMQSASTDSLWLWTGNHQIAFVASDASARDRAKLEAAVQNLIDLDALGALKAE